VLDYNSALFWESPCSDCRLLACIRSVVRENSIVRCLTKMWQVLVQFMANVWQKMFDNVIGSIDFSILLFFEVHIFSIFFIFDN